MIPQGLLIPMGRFQINQVWPPFQDSLCFLSREGNSYSLLSGMNVHCSFFNLRFHLATRLFWSKTHSQGFLIWLGTAPLLCPFPKNWWSLVVLLFIHPDGLATVQQVLEALTERSQPSEGGRVNLPTDPPAANPSESSHQVPVEVPRGECLEPGMLLYLLRWWVQVNINRRHPCASIGRFRNLAPRRPELWKLCPRKWEAS